MPKFFVKQEQVKNQEIEIINEDVKHIKNVLRKQIDDEIEICDNDTGKNYMCKIEEIQKEKIICKIIQKLESISEPKVKVSIFQGLPKADKMELIIQKSVELGVEKIIPTNLKRCIVKIDKKEEKKKLERWQKISEVAAKQSGRDTIPQIKNIINIKELCEKVKEYDIILVAYEQEKENTLKQELQKIKNKPNAKIGVVIGPEGGIDAEEIEQLKQAGAKIITLGQRILRTETVALNVLSIIMYELED